MRRPNMSREVEEEITGILFGEGIRCFGRDWFDGSKEERRIYMEVLHEKSRGNLSEASSKKMNDDCSMKQSSDVNAEISVYTIDSSLKVPNSATANPKSQCHIVESCLLSSLSFDDFPVLWSSEAKASSMNCALRLQQSTDTPASSGAFRTRDLTVRLRSYACHILEDADWKVQVRKRKTPGKDGLGLKRHDYYFLSPEGRMLHSLSKAWVACGSMLLSSTKNGRADDETERVWVDVAEFWFELESILVYVDKNFQDLEKSAASLLHRWRILDPFMAVLCINKKVGALNQGMVVKSVGSEAIVLSDNKRLYLASKGADKLQGHSFPGNLSHTVFPDSGLQVTECSRGRQVSPLNDSKNLKRKPRHWKLIDRASHPYNRTHGRMKHSLSSVPANDMLFHETLSTVGSSKPDFLNLCENSSIQSNSMYSSPIDRSPNPDCFSPPDKSNIENDSFKESRVDQQAHSNDTPCSSMIAVNYKEKPGLHYALGDSIRSLSFQETHDFGDGSLFKLIDSSYNTHWRAEEAAEVREQNRTDFENTGNFFIVNLAHEHPVAGQENLLFYPQQKTVCCNLDGYCREELVGHFVSPCDLGGNMQQEIQSYFCQSSNLDIAQPFNSSNNSSHDTGFPFQVGIIGSASEDNKLIEKLAEQGILKKSGCPKHVNDRLSRSEIMKLYDEKQTTCLVKQRPTRSKKISEAQSTKSSCKKPKKNTDNEVISRSSTISKSSELVAIEANAKGYKLKLEDVVVSVELQHDGSFDEAMLSGPVNSQVVTELKNTGVCKKRGRRTDSCLVSHIIEAIDYKSCCKFLADRGRNSDSQASRNPIRVERSCRSLAQPARREGKTFVDAKEAQRGTRTVLCWLIKMGMISFGDIMQYQTSRNNAVVKEGRITKAGIFCKCCKKVFTVSDFKRHAGCKLQKPSLNLFLKSGKPYILCQLQAWSAEYRLRKDGVQTKKVEDGDKNDDTCSFCANDGELICCDSCPSTYHQACLYLQELPEGSWHCPNCSCAFCGYVLNVTEDSDSIATMECSQCERRYHEMCIKEKIRCDAVGSNMWFCGKKCLQVYTGLHSLVGVMNCANDGFSWTVLKCNHDKKFHSAQKTAQIAECNTKLAIALSIMEESFLPMLDPRTGNNMFPQFLYNLGMNTAPANSQGFYTVALEKDDELFSVATIRVHGVTLAEMPLIATCIEQRRKGMCRRLMHAIEEMLKNLRVEMLVLSAIPYLVDTWISTFGFKHVNDDDKKKLSSVKLTVFPGATLLKKAMYECEDSESVG